MGTTGAVAKKLGRRWIGLEREESYAAAAAERLRMVQPYESAVIETTTAKRKEVRIPFGALLERRLVAPGDLLYSPDGAHTAKVRADGTLVCREESGSIHKVAARLRGAETCNGWTYWHVRRDGEDASIDLLRQEVRRELAGAA